MNKELEMAFNYAKFTHRNIFLTGKAGTGKTTFLRNLQNQTKKRMIVVAPTGVAAINAGGVTIHSFFQLAPGMYLPGQNFSGRDKQSKYSYSKHKLNILRTLDLLVIDEISMVRCDLLDAIDEVLRRYQSRYLPFGGVQLLMIGDLQQLAPVAKDDEWMILKQHGYESPYFFGSQALRKTNYTTIELKEVYRQADPTFVDLLNQVRDNRLTPESFNILNGRYRANFRPSEKEGYITLTTHNYQAQDINAMQMTLLPTQPQKYRAKVNGEFPDTSYPTDAELTLKIGAQVMFCKNDPNHQYYNGKIGRVVKCDAERIYVECQPDSLAGAPSDGEPKMIEVTPQIWENTRYSTNQKTGEITEESIGKFEQMPLKTAWAITIHKSQGLTFEHAIIEADRAFSPGQVYVALSRCRSLEGLVLSSKIPASAITVDPQVMRYNQFIQENQPTAKQLIDDRRYCIEEILDRIFDFNPILMRMNYFVNLCDQHLHKVWPMYVQKAHFIRDEIQGMTEQQKRNSLLCVGMNFQQQIHTLMPNSENFDDNEVLKERLVKGFSWFLNRTTDLLQDFLEEGLPEIDNQADREQMQKELDLLENDYDMKVQIFTKCLKGFSLNDYWEAKAIASMNAEDPNKAKSNAKNKTKAKSKTKTESLSSLSSPRSNLLAKSDIKNPELWEELRKWRMEKATIARVPVYNILSNATMLGIANEMPTTAQEFLGIKGFGKTKLTAFGQELAEIVDKYR